MPGTESSSSMSRFSSKLNALLSLSIDINEACFACIFRLDTRFCVITRLNLFIVERLYCCEPCPVAELCYLSKQFDARSKSEGFEGGSLGGTP